MIEAFLLKYKDTPWERGKHDCVMLIWKYTQEVWNKPFADPDKYPYSDMKSSIKVFRVFTRDNGVSSFKEVLDKHYYRTSFPIEGGLVAKPDTEGLLGYAHGICYGGFGYFVDKNGLVALELNPTTDLYWSIE